MQCYGRNVNEALCATVPTANVHCGRFWYDMIVHSCTAALSIALRLIMMRICLLGRCGAACIGGEFPGTLSHAFRPRPRPRLQRLAQPRSPLRVLREAGPSACHALPAAGKACSFRIRLKDACAPGRAHSVDLRPRAPRRTLRFRGIITTDQTSSGICQGAGRVAFSTVSSLHSEVWSSAAATTLRKGWPA
jgi:hypothetical protein